MKIKKTLSCIVAASFLTLCPISANALTSVEVKEIQKKYHGKLISYAINLAVDLDDDGTLDKKGYEMLFKKLNLDYSESKSPTELNKTIREHILNLNDEKLEEEIYNSLNSMFTGKDSESYSKKRIDLTFERFDEIHGNN